MDNKEWRQSVWFTVIGLILTVGLIIFVVWLASFLSKPIGIKPISIYILVLAFGGGLGGLCYSLIENKGYLKLCSVHQYEDKKPDVKDEKPDAKDKKLGLDLGCVADVLIGIGSAFAIFLVLSGLVKLTRDSIELGTIFMLAALGIVAGAGGKYIFPMLVEKMQKMIETEKTAGEAKQTAENAEKKASNVGQEAENKHRESLEQIDTIRASVGNVYIIKDKPTRKDLVLAELAYLNALEAEPNSVRAKVGLATIRKRQGNLPEAIQLCTEAITINSNFAGAYYNRACYKCLSKQLPSEIISDLRKAIELDATLRNYAKTDPDFDSIKGSKEFLEIVGTGK